MAKTIKTVGALTRAAKTETTPKVAVRRNGNGNGNGSTTNGGSATVPAKKRKSTPVTSVTSVTSAAASAEDIALRAYFIAEKRRAAGIPGDELGDWVEAERQLLVEAARK